MIILIIFITLILWVIIWGGVTQWRFIIKKKENFKNSTKVCNKAYIINLNKSIDRLKNFKNQYKNLQLQNIFGKLIRFSAIDGNLVDIPDYWFKYDTYTKIYPRSKASSAFGNYMSHYALLNNFLQSENSNIIIFEDDASFVDNFVDKFKIFYDNVPSDWEVLVLNYTENSPPDKINKYCNKAGKGGVNLTGSYIINKKGAKKYIDHFNSNKKKEDFTANEPVDCQISRIQGSMNVYLPSSQLVIQDTMKFKSGTYK